MSFTQFKIRGIQRMISSFSTTFEARTTLEMLGVTLEMFSFRKKTKRAWYCPLSRVINRGRHVTIILFINERLLISKHERYSGKNLYLKIKTFYPIFSPQKPHKATIQFCALMIDRSNRSRSRQSA